jgi:hypothetical protein
MITDAQAAAADEFWHVVAHDEDTPAARPIAIARRRGPTVYGEPPTSWSIPVVIHDAAGGAPDAAIVFVITNDECVPDGLRSAGWCVPELWAAERHLFRIRSDPPAFF